MSSYDRYVFMLVVARVGEGGGLFPPAEMDPGVFYQEETIRCIWQYVEQVDVSGCESPTG